MIKINNLHKNFGKLAVLKGIDLTVAEKEVVVIIGQVALVKVHCYAALIT